MTTIRRWAFFPLLLLVCMSLGSAIANPRDGSQSGALVGALVAVPLGGVIAYWRRHHGATAPARHGRHEARHPGGRAVHG
jgi:hypothetical protein